MLISHELVKCPLNFSYFFFSSLTIVLLLMSFKTFNALSSVPNNGPSLSVVVMFETSWLFSANMMAVILRSQPAGCNSVSTLAVAVTSKLISLSQVSEYSDSFLLTSCTLYATLCICSDPSAFVCCPVE